MKTKELTILALFIALSVVFSLVKVPSPTGSVALDAMPAFVAAGVLGPVAGGIVGFFGHLATAANSGFYLGLPSHFIIGGVMFVACYAYGFFYAKKNLVMAIGSAFFINVVLSLIPFTMMYGMGFFNAMWLPLSIGCIINVVIATVVIKPLKKAIK